MADGEAARLDYLKQLLTEAREEVARADAKASVLFGAFGVTSAGVGAVLLADGWLPFDLHNAVEWAWWAGAGAAAMGLLLLGLAVVPRITNVSDSEHLYYFGHVAEYETLGAFERQLDAASLDTWRRTLDQVWTVSRIAKRKYVLTRRSMISFLVAAGLFAGAAVTDAALSVPPE